MRTVAFSDAGLVKVLNDEFVCAWVNKRPDLKFKDGLYSKPGCGSGLPNGAAVANVTSVFAAPDGTVLHAVPGVLDAPAFQRHIKFARSLHAELADVPRGKRAGLYFEAHRRAAKTAPDVESTAHTALSARFMRVDELPLTYFDCLGRVWV